MANHLLIEFIIRSIRNDTYKWTSSGLGTDEYYCELAAGGDPSLYSPRAIAFNGTEGTLGTLGSLAVANWGYGDNDTLGYDTVYVRLSDGSDPDDAAKDYVGYMEFISPEGTALEHWWDDRFVSFDNISRQLAEEHGGYNRMGFGRIAFAQDLFEDDWPPPINGKITIKYTDSTEAAAVTFFSGTAHLVKITRENVEFELWEEVYSADLLSEAIDINGDTVPLSMAIGTITHGNPVQLATLATYYRYDLANMSGAGSTHDTWHVFDDGVDICSNITRVGNNVFELSATPVGEVTISGIGTVSTVEEVFDWACGASYLNLTLASSEARAISPRISYWANSQEKVIDFLSSIAAYNTHLFYTSASTLTLVDMFVNNSSRTLTEFDFFPAQYSYHLPTKKITANWTIGEAGEWAYAATKDNPAAVYVKRTDKELVVGSDYSYGNEIEITPYHYDMTTISTALNKILTILHKPKCNIRLPLQGDLPNPGEKLSWTDTAHNVSTDMFINARTLHYNFTTDEIVIEGEGEITAT